ncbi:MAG: recombinase family protein [Oscillospiraceae bacterium]|nr:recombinase family protein [Oscillospiraceae bacterium]
MKAVIYARYSSDNQGEESIEGQLRECKEYADKNDIVIVKNYIDRALSAKTDNRPEFQRMIKDSSKGLFDVVLVWKLDRFARNRYDSAHYKSILRKSGVKVISAKETISDGPEGIILESMLEGYAEYYSAELSQKVTRGMTENALKAKYNGGTMPLGYMVGSDRRYAVNPDTAPIVEEIFTRYANGDLIIDIVNSLNSRGFKSTKGADFNKSSLHMMLKNRKYIGEYKYKDIVIPGGIPPIISEDIFKKVQQRMERNKHAPAKEKAKINYLLSTKLFCGKCGALMLGESGYGSKGNMYHYYKCANNKRRKTCGKRAVKKDWIEDLVIRLTKEMVLHDDIIERIADTIYNLQFKENTILKALRKSLSDLEASINNMLDAIQMGVVTSSTKQRLEELERRKSDIEVSIMNEEIEHPALSKENIIFWISRFKYLDMDIEENRQYLVDTFVNSIYLYDDKLVITYNIKDGTRTITLEELENSNLVQNGSP